MLSSEMVYHLTEIKCKRHNVSFEYLYDKVYEQKFPDGTALINELDRIMAEAYFKEFYALYKGILPYRECYDDVDKAMAETSEHSEEKQ